MVWLVCQARPSGFLLESVRWQSFSVACGFMAHNKAGNRSNPLRMGLSGFHHFLCCRNRDCHLVINTLTYTIMMIDIAKSVAFTGHRPERIRQSSMLCFYLDIVSQVRRLYSLGYRNFLSGMAEGFDLLAAQAVASLKTEYTDIRLIAVVPFRRQANRYRQETSPCTTG